MTEGMDNSTDRAKIVWLASYPKSGNTWTRMVLAQYQAGNDAPIDINNMPQRNTIASARGAFDNHTLIASGCLTHDEVDRLRPRVYERMAEHADETLFNKIHDAFHLTTDGEPMVSTRATRGALYIIRHPLDVCVSSSHHNGASIDRSIEHMGNEDATFAGGTRRQNDQLRQRMGSWSDHVLSWVDNPDVPVHTMRYEDMKASPLDTFAAAFEFVGIDVDRQRLATSIELTAFDKLKAKEQESGFRERSRKTQSFFRSGKAGGWRDVLTPEQAQRLCTDHAQVMERFGYSAD